MTIRYKGLATGQFVQEELQDRNYCHIPNKCLDLNATVYITITYPEL